MLENLWVEKYSPKTIEEYVFLNDELEQKVKEWLSIKDGIPIPNVIFNGSPGIGKTSLAKLLCKELNVHQRDIMMINASDENNVETVRNKIKTFCSTYPIGDYKVIILDEFDGFTPSAQNILRGEIENNYDTCRFILTCNYPNKISPAIKSRIQKFDFYKMDKDQYYSRCADILLKEKVEFEIQDFKDIVDSCYPDLRLGINVLQKKTIGGKLYQYEKEDNSLDYVTEIISLFKNKEISKARKLIIEQARPEEYVEIYRFMYDNLDMFGDEGMQENALLIIAEGLKDHYFVADTEINLSATLIKLSKLYEK